jgi:hypothetical protein
MDAWIVAAIVIVLGALAADRTRAYRALPALLNRLRGRSRSVGRPQTLGVDSKELPPVQITRSDFADRKKGAPHGEGHWRRRGRCNGP